MRKQQLEDKNLVAQVKKHIDKFGMDRYTYKEVEGVELIHENDQMLVLDAAQKCVLDWYHSMLVNPGIQMILNSIQSVFHWQGIQKHVKKMC